MASFKNVLKQNRTNIEAVARHNTHINEDGYATISKNDPWVQEEEWDSHHEELTDTDNRSRMAAY